MTFALFGPAAVPGGPAAHSLGPFQPVLDSSGQPAPEPDDGLPSAPIVLRSLSAGVLQSPADPGLILFDGSGLEVTSILMAARMVLFASSPSHGRRPGQIRYRWISDVLVRPRSGRRDAGGVRILFLDPAPPDGFGGRLFADLSTARQLRPEVLAWDLLQRIAVDRHRWLSSTALPDHRMVEELLARGPSAARSPASYAIPVPSISAGPGRARPVAVTTAAPGDIEAETVRILPTWSPDLVSAGETSASATAPAQLSATATATATTTATTTATATEQVPPSGGAMIMSVPGVGRHAAEAPPAPAMVRSPSEGTPGSVRSYRVEMDSGEMVLVDSPVLFGRDPAALHGEDVRVHAVSDRSLSFSKTHLLLSPSPDGIAVTDRHSTNGVLVLGSGRSSRCVPGVPQSLEPPVTLQVGTRTMEITVAGWAS